MRGVKHFAIGALFALTMLLSAQAQPPGAAGLVWLDNELEFKLNAGKLVTTGAVSTTINIGSQPAVCLVKSPNTLDIQLDLSVFFPGLPTITLTGTALAGGSQINWSVGSVPINLCLTTDDIPDLPLNILVKRITGGNLRVDATILGSPYFSSACNRSFWVEMQDTGGNASNYLNLELYAFCAETPFTRINATLRDLDFIVYSGPVPEPASLLALGTGLVGLLGLRRRK
jgi:hypothetical protein